MCLPAYGQRLKPFSTDLCTHYPNYSKDGTLRPYSQCCLMHDLEYWVGGTQTERKQADRNLKHCFKSLGYDMRSRLVFEGVRIFGKPYWGYAWTDLKPSYWELTPDQRLRILESLSDSDLITLDQLLFIIVERDL